MKGLKVELTNNKSLLQELILTSLDWSRPSLELRAFSHISTFALVQTT